MKVIIYAAPTPNGMIAKEHHNEGYVSAANWQLFVKTVQQTGNAVLGSGTFEVAAKTGAFPIHGALNIVMTRKKVENKWGGDALFTNKSPREVIKLLKSKGFKRVIIAGGSFIYASFIRDKLVDEIWLDFQPEIFGKGTPLFSAEDFDVKLKLIGTKRLSRNEMQLRYTVLNKSRS